MEQIVEVLRDGTKDTPMATTITILYGELDCKSI